MTKFRWQLPAIAALVIVAAIVGWTLLSQRPTGERSGVQSFVPPVNVNLALGNPSDANDNVITNANNYLVVKPQYVLSYNNSKHIPNWVSWQLNKSWLGNVPRRNDFRPDPSLPKGWYAVASADYNGSGYDRGHMTPSADRSRDPETNSTTFFMTNIIPQAPDNNQGVWQKLESYCRDLANAGKDLYIISGGYGEKRSIGSKVKISVPERTWKVIVVLDQAGSNAANVTANTRVIAVDIPNEQGVREANWRTFRVSVDQLEAKTGYNFLTNVTESVQQAIESRVDQG
jgi:endonuclease G, mitochondrial